MYRQVIEIWLKRNHRFRKEKKKDKVKLSEIFCLKFRTPKFLNSDWCELNAYVKQQQYESEIFSRTGKARNF